MKLAIIIASGLMFGACSSLESVETSYSLTPVPVATTVPMAAASNATAVLEPKRFKVEFPELVFTLRDIDPGDFRIRVDQNTADIEPLSYGGIDGARVVIEMTVLDELSSSIRFEIGALQYLTDDRPAVPLAFSHQTEWTAVRFSNKEIQIPQFYENRENVMSVYTQLGFSSKGEFFRSLETAYFEEIKSSSYAAQKDVYTKLLGEDRKKYVECCPEYITQAERFMDRPKSDFKTLSDLGVELFLEKLTLEISGLDEKGRSMHFTVIGN